MDNVYVILCTAVGESFFGPSWGGESKRESINFDKGTCEGVTNGPGKVDGSAAVSVESFISGVFCVDLVPETSVVDGGIGGVPASAPCDGKLANQTS